MDPGSGELDGRRRAQYGQFFTPAPVAVFIASLIDLPQEGTIRLLDPGAGIGSLTAALVARVIRERPDVRVAVVAFELDDALTPHLHETLSDCERAARKAGGEVTTELRQEDFIAWASAVLCGSLLVTPETFSACVMNPPYRKVNNHGADRRALECIGLPITNLYAAFLALAAGLLEPGGQLAAITPRSFANGVYFRPFRQFFLSRISLNRLHVYDKRGCVFADADVLQENVVFCGTRDGDRASVTLSSSAGYDDAPVVREVPYEEVVSAGDPHAFVRIPVDGDATLLAARVADLPASLDELDVQVSTGRVVDFRARDYLREEHQPGAAPLIYPRHLRGATIAWPQPALRKPNALVVNEETAPLLLPNETYVIVKRFTAKEEPRRVVAALFSAGDVPGEVVAFENHLNVYHGRGRGLPPDLAGGLTAYLNSTIVDLYVRQFSGHTQINATDLRHLRYPSQHELGMLGRAVADCRPETQDELDALAQHHIFELAPASDEERPGTATVAVG